MDPISIAMGVTSLLGTGISLFGSSKEAALQQQEAQISGQISGLDQQVNAQRQQQMVLVAQRQQMQTLRNSQLARSMAINSAVNQGAQFGSGVAGGLGQISAQTGTDLLNLNQNLEIGKNIYGLNNQIDSLKIQMAALGGDAAKYGGLTNIGRGISTSAGPLARLGSLAFGNFGGGSSGTSATQMMNNFSMPTDI